MQLPGARFKEVIAVERLYRNTYRDQLYARRADRPQLNWGVSPRTTDQCVVAGDGSIRQARRGDKARGLVRPPSGGPDAPQSLYRDGIV